MNKYAVIFCLMLIPTVTLAAEAGAQGGGDIPAQGNAEAGKQVAQDICAMCHGLDGNAVVDEYPDLANQNQPYLVNALKAYREHRRTGGNAGIMQPQAERLTPQQVADVAAYYSSLQPAP